MSDSLPELPHEYQQRLEEFLTLRDGDGTIVAGAEARAIELLKELVTESGRLEPSVAERLGGQPARGRKDIIPLLLQALIGPEPVAPAWLDAQAAGGFHLFKPLTYRACGGGQADEDARRIGSVGSYLPRMLAQYSADSHNRRLPAGHRRAQYTEITTLTAIMIFKSLQDSTRARMALGPAWTIMAAVDTLPMAVQRKIDALSGDEAYRAAVAQAVAEVTARFEPVTGRTNTAVKTSLPDGVVVEDYFAERERVRHQAAIDDVTAALRECLKPQDQRGELDPGLASAMEGLIREVRDAELDQDTIRRLVAEATAYLDEQPDLSPEDRECHAERLAILFPSLHRLRRVEELFGASLPWAGFILHHPQKVGARFTGNAGIDAVLTGILARILRQVERRPPPPNTPAEHLPFYEVFAMLSSMYRPRGLTANWPEAARSRYPLIDDETMAQGVEALRASGLAGLDPTWFRAAVREAIPR